MYFSTQIIEVRHVNSLKHVMLHENLVLFLKKVWVFKKTRLTSQPDAVLLAFHVAISP